MSKKLFSKFIVLLLVVGLLFAVAPKQAFAQTADTSWYSEGPISFTLMDADDLAGLAQLVNAGNNFSGKTILLGADIDLSVYTNWDPIGGSWAEPTFRGVFDGQNHVISNLTSTRPDEEFVGLFGSVAGTIQNFTLTGVNVTGRNQVGGATGMLYPDGTANNVTVNNATINAKHWAGGIAGYVFGQLDNVHANTVTVILTFDTVANDNGDKGGGLIGYLSESTLSNCSATQVTVSGTRDVGGLVGAAGDTTISNCTVNGATVTSTNIDGNTLTPYTGGAVGRASHPLTITNVNVTNATLTSTPEGYTGLVVGGGSGPVTINNVKLVHGTTETFYATIQAAIDVAVTGDTIEVAAGTYNLTTAVQVDKEVTITGPTTGEATVIGVGGGSGTTTLPDKVFEITAPNVTIENLSLTLASMPGTYTGMISVPDSSGPGIIQGITISNNKMFLPQQSGAMGTWWGQGINLGRYVGGAVISGNEIYNTRSGIVVSYNSQVNITNNVIYNTKGGIMNYTGSLADAANRVMTGNSWGTVHNEWDIVWNTGGAPYDMDMNIYVLQVSQANNDAYVCSLMSTLVPQSTLTGNRSHVFAATTGTTTVRYDNGNINLPYAKIQDAIDAVVPGGKVYVAAGTYAEENITITKGISLLGAGAASTSIAPTAVTDNSTIIVQDPSGDVRIDGFNFIMQPKPSYGSAVAVTGTGIAVDSATVTISNNVITGSNDGSKSDYGFYGQNNNAKVIIENNTINNTGNNPICFEGQAGSTFVHNNVFHIVASPDYDPYFSMAYGGLTVSTPQIVEGNTFYLDHAGTGWASAITFNTAPRNDWSGLTTDSGHYTNIQIRENVIYTNGPQARGINLADRSAGGGLGTITGVVITGNQIIGENLTDVNTYGIAVKGDVQGTQILSNTINQVDIGIRIIPGNGTTPICPSGSTISSNQITSVGVSVKNECTSGSVDAARNWWGSATGPAAGQMVGDVSYIPWCANAACTEFLPAAVTIAPVDPIVCGNVTTSTIDINVAGIPTATPLQGYEFRLHFDPTRTTVTTPPTDVVNGGFIANGGFLVTQWLNADGSVSETSTGILRVAYTQFTPSTSIGSGKLASITLTHLGVAGDIDLSLSDVVLSTRDGFVIPSEASATPITLTLQPAVLNTTKSLGYCDLASAVLAASADDTLQLQADIAIPTTVSINKSLTLDLNGKVATYSPTENTFALNVDGATTTLTLIDGISPSTGKILVVDGDTDAAKDGRGIEVTNGGTLLFNSGTIEAPYAGVYLMENAKMTLNGGTVDSFYGLVTRKPGASLTVTTGTITADGFAISGNGSVGQAPTTILINGGTITSTATAIYHPQDGTLTINGGTISGYNGIEMKAGNLVVSDGTILGTGAFAEPLPNDDGSTNTGDAILLNGRNVYTGDITVTISGTPTITSTNAYALREYVGADQTLKTSSVVISGGSFTGGAGKEAVTFSPELKAAELAIPETANLELLPGGLYNTNPAAFVFVPYGTKLNTTLGMYEIVGISLNVNDFYYNDDAPLRGVSTDFYATNFVFSDAISVTVRLYAGEEGVYVLQQTNVLKVPSSHNTDVLTSSFDYFGTYVSNSWANTEASTFDVTAVPTRVEVTVVLPGGTLEGFKNLPTGDRTTILPGVNGLVTLQGILAPRAGVGIILTPVSGVTRTTSSNEMTGINYWFTGVETLTYTFTTSQPRYLNLTATVGTIPGSDKTFLVDRDLTLNALRLYGGDVNQDNIIYLSDASAVGTAWGSTLNPEANINYDGIVNIQDLALVGGNYGLTSATAYTGWSPLP